MGLSVALRGSYLPFDHAWPRNGRFIQIKDWNVVKHRPINYEHVFAFHIGPYEYAPIEEEVCDWLLDNFGREGWIVGIRQGWWTFVQIIDETHATAFRLVWC